MKSKFLKLSDEELQKLVSKENQAAFEVIFDRYWKRLYLYAYRIFQQEDVCEDIVQEIFISLWNNASNSLILNLEAYLFRAVKYKIANHIRSLKFEKDQTDILEGMPSPSESFNDVEYIELEQSLNEQIQKLSPKCREVFILSRVENLSNFEIAGKLNLSIHTVEKHISNALKELRSTLHTWQFHVIAIFLLC